jgi:hypothetical protein
MPNCHELHYLELTWAARAYKSTWSREKDGDPKLIADHKRECRICSAPISVELVQEVEVMA